MGFGRGGWDLEINSDFLLKEERYFDSYPFAVKVNGKIWI